MADPKADLVRLRCWWLNRHDRTYWLDIACDRAIPERWANHLLGISDDGELYAPSLTRDDWWDRFDARNPRHWRFWLATRISRRINSVEVP